MIVQETVEYKVREILSAMFASVDVSVIEMETPLENKLGIDSLKTLQLIVELEQVFDIEVDDDDLLFENFATIHKIVELITRMKV